MEKRLVLFIALSFAILMVNFWFESMRRAQNKLAGAGNNVAQQGDNKKPGDNKPPDKKPGEPPAKEAQPGGNKPPEPPVVPGPGGQAPGGAVPAEEAKKIEPSWFTLGSVAAPDSGNPYEMLVTLTSRGAAVQRVELSNPRFLD